MNVPAIARKTFEELRHLVEYNSIVNHILDILTKKSLPIERARFTHQSIEDYNLEVFSHPLVKELSPCKEGCSACCHTQVSVTEDEANLLVARIKAGVEIDKNRLDIQMKAENDPHAFFKLKYADRRCIFLDEQGSCRVYQDRPAVCRTNAVLGSADQCDTSFAIKPLRMVRTPKADMVIYASFLFSKKSGSLSQMVGELLKGG
jgi:Fe-S-cluster containining protein